ncbi:MAG: hypothetical protein JKY81_01365 [Colwellia sp.]|nr:hypothetical protein [Colwellia sp.]
MQYPAHGRYSIERQNNILLIDAQGPFNDVVTEQYHQDIMLITKKMSSNPWASLVSFKGNGVFTPDAEHNLIETTHYRVKNGMVAVAAVILDSAYADILQMQLQRIYQSCQIQFHFFSDTKNARKWLDSFIN